MKVFLTEPTGLQMYSFVITLAAVVLLTLYLGERVYRRWAIRDRRKMAARLAKREGSALRFTDGLLCPECGGLPYTNDGEPCHFCEGLGRVPEGLATELDLTKERVKRLEDEIEGHERVRRMERDHLEPFFRLLVMAREAAEMEEAER